MKLTKAQRADFVAAVMKDLPRPAMIARRVAIKNFQDACIASLPKDVLNVFKKYPKMFHNEPFQLAGFYVSYGKRDTHADYSNYVYAPVVDSGKLPLDPDYSTQQPYLDEVAAVQLLEKRLVEVVGACVTLSDLKTALPEFEKYMPEAPNKVIRPLPVAAGGLVADLCGLGHPVCASRQDGAPHHA